MNTPINFELAKLLKEKGFDERCKGHWYEHNIQGKVISGISYPQTDFNKWYRGEILAPTIADVIMWLYEKHGIWISVYSDKVLNWESLFSIRIDWIYPKDSPDSEDIEPKYYKYKGKNEFNSLTEAYSAAIEYCLNNLI